MRITINGQSRDIAGTADIASVLKEEGYEGRLVAVARNGEFVPKRAYAATDLSAGDMLEIVAPMQGG
jgi:sulfur carrier protein